MIRQKQQKKGLQQNTNKQRSSIQQLNTFNKNASHLVRNSKVKNVQRGESTNKSMSIHQNTNLKQGERVKQASSYKFYNKTINDIGISDNKRIEGIQKGQRPSIARNLPTQSVKAKQNNKNMTSSNISKQINNGNSLKIINKPTHKTNSISYTYLNNGNNSSANLSRKSTIKKSIKQVKKTNNQTNKDKSLIKTQNNINKLNMLNCLPEYVVGSLKLLMGTVLDAQKICNELYLFSKCISTNYNTQKQIQLPIPWLHEAIKRYEENYKRFYSEEIRYYIISTLWDQGMVKVGEYEDWEQIIKEQFQRNKGAQIGVRAAKCMVELSRGTSINLLNSNINKPYARKDSLQKISKQLVPLIQSIEQQYYRQIMTFVRFEQSLIKYKESQNINSNKNKDNIINNTGEQHRYKLIQQNMYYIFELLDKSRVGSISIRQFLQYFQLNFPLASKSELFLVRKLHKNQHLHNPLTNTIGPPHTGSSSKINNQQLDSIRIYVQNIAQIVNRLYVSVDRSKFINQNQPSVYRSTSYQVVGQVMGIFGKLKHKLLAKYEQQHADKQRQDNNNILLIAQMENIRHAAHSIIQRNKTLANQQLHQQLNKGNGTAHYLNRNIDRSLLGDLQNIKTGDLLYNHRYCGQNDHYIDSQMLKQVYSRHVPIQNVSLYQNYTDLKKCLGPYRYLYSQSQQKPYRNYHYLEQQQYSTNKNIGNLGLGDRQSTFRNINIDAEKTEKNNDNRVGTDGTAYKYPHYIEQNKQVIDNLSKEQGSIYSKLRSDHKQLQPQPQKTKQLQINPPQANQFNNQATYNSPTYQKASKIPNNYLNANSIYSIEKENNLEDLSTSKKVIHDHDPQIRIFNAKQEKNRQPTIKSELNQNYQREKDQQLASRQIDRQNPEKQKILVEVREKAIQRLLQQTVNLTPLPPSPVQHVSKAKLVQSPKTHYFSQFQQNYDQIQKLANYDQRLKERIQNELKYIELERLRNRLRYYDVIYYNQL